MRDYRTIEERLQTAVVAWEHQLLELRARFRHGQHSTEQRQILRQQIIELDSRIDVAKLRLSAAA